MNLFSGTNGLSMFTGYGEAPRLNRAQIIQRDNERANFEAITRLVIRSLLDDAMHSSNRLIEGDSQMLSDLLMMLEKILFHGFRSSMKNALIAMKTPDSELWGLLTRICRTHEDLRESVICIDRLDTLLTPISKIRGILRLTMMQKKLSEFFEVIVNSALLKDFYDNWAFLRDEKAIAITGALVGLRVLECNLVLEYDNLQEQPLTIDLSLYLKLPTVDTSEDGKADTKTNFDKERKTLLDQNNYLEERIRKLERDLDDNKKKLEKVTETKSEISFDMNSVSYRPEVNEAEEEENNEKQELEKLKAENESLSIKICELQDSLALSEQHVSDKANVCTGLYEDLRLSEECVKKMEQDFIKLKNNYNEDKQDLCKRIDELEKLLQDSRAELKQKDDCDDSLKTEFQRKCELHNDAISTLENKQKLLSDSEEKIINLERKVEEARQQLKDFPKLKEENRRLKEQLEAERYRADDNERALEELGGSLSEIKLRMLELTEDDLLALTDAQWAKDSEVSACTSCHEVFTFAKRKHHCRKCGSIFCGACSEGRVKLPSNAKPARVCDSCYALLKSRSSNNHKN